MPAQDLAWIPTVLAQDRVSSGWATDLENRISKLKRALSGAMTSGMSGFCPMHPFVSRNTTPTSESQLAFVLFMSHRQHGQLEGLWAPGCSELI